MQAMGEIYTGTYSGTGSRVSVVAQNNDEAKRLLEAQYGRGTISNVQWNPKGR